jgi:hypothetical protein
MAATTCDRAEPFQGRKEFFLRPDGPSNYRRGLSFGTLIAAPALYL